MGLELVVEKVLGKLYQLKMFTRTKMVDIKDR
jgi:hypothetical protein